MQVASINEMKKALQEKSPKELVEFCLELAKFKKENKEMLNYLLFASTDEHEFLEDAKNEISIIMSDMSYSHFYTAKKVMRKALKITRQYIKYSKDKITEIELVLHFCQELTNSPYDIGHHPIFYGQLDRLLKQIEKKLEKMHEDILADYISTIEELKTHLPKYM